MAPEEEFVDDRRQVIGNLVGHHPQQGENKGKGRL